MELMQNPVPRTEAMMSFKQGFCGSSCSLHDLCEKSLISENKNCHFEAPIKCIKLKNYQASILAVPKSCITEFNSLMLAF